MRILFILLVLLIISPIVSSAEKINDLDVEWDSSTTYTLSWTNPSVTKGDYVIKVIDFNWKGDAVVSVTYNNETKNGVLSQAENTIFDFTKNATYFQGVKIYPVKVSNFLPFPTNIGTYPCCPAAEITVYITKIISEKKPELELTILSDWDGRAGYTSDFSFKMENTGDNSFSEGNITINLSGLKIADARQISDQSLTYNPSKDIVTRSWSTPLFANNSYNVNLSLKPTFPANTSSFTIKAESYFKDTKGKVYSVITSKTVSLTPTLSFKKLISASTLFSKDRTYGRTEIDTSFLPKVFGLQTVTVVNLYIENTQSYPLKSVILNDSIMRNYVLINDSVSPVKNVKMLKNNTKLQWVFDINEGERKEFRYEMIAKKTGTFTAPAATAEWVQWGELNTKSSTTPSTTVHGVYIVVLKKTDKSSFRLNETLNVSLTLENIGGYPAGINVTDILPEDSTFISGITTFSGYLQPKESTTFKYILSSDYSGELEFPSPEINLWKEEYKGAYGVIPAANVTVIDPSAALIANTTNITQGSEVVPTPTETPLPKSLIDVMGEKAPWLEGVVPIVMLLIAIILMLMLHVINREK